MPNLRHNILKGLRKLPGIKNPKSELSRIKNMYYWALLQRDKSINLNIGTYFEAMKMPWVKVCTRVLTNRIMGLNFEISNPNEHFNDISNSNYLTQIMNNPMGLYHETFYTKYIMQMFGSFFGPGDAFARVHHDTVFDNVINGLEFLPMEWVKYYSDTDQWGLKYSDVRFETNEIIHFAEPSIRGSKWGPSLIDVLAKHLTLEIYGLKFNRSVFENEGLDPTGILKYDIDIDPDDIEREIERIERDKKENPNGTLIIQGGEFIRATNTNKEMQYIELSNMIRDITLSVYGVPPAEAGIIETGNIGAGTGTAQDKTMKQNLLGWLKLFEGEHNKVFGRNGFQEVFKFDEIDLEDKLKRAQIEDKQVRNGTRYINEVRNGYGLEPVDWGNVPMDYNKFGVTSNPANVNNIDNLGGDIYNQKDLSESIRQVRSYKNKLYMSDVLSEWSE